MANVKSVLFPRSYICGFTTCPAVILPDIKNIRLSDASLGVHRVAGRTTHDIVTPPSPHSHLGNLPDQAYEAFYPKGGINPRADLPSGFSFYVSGPEWFRERAMEAREVSWSYRVMFENGWEGAKGGKLPGVFGGTGEKAYGCSGGRKENRCRCFSLRLMWRSFFCFIFMLRTHVEWIRLKNTGEIYAYVPPLESNVKSLLSVPPFSVENPDYGISVGRGAFRFEPGTWTALCTRLRLNHIGEQNGEQSPFFAVS
jgi:hypothetical protein